MAVKIRLKRMGRKKKPFYRVVERRTEWASSVADYIPGVQFYEDGVVDSIQVREISWSAAEYRRNRTDFVQRPIDVAVSVGVWVASGRIIDNDG